MGFTKLFSSIVTSSVWVEDDKTLRVWIAMLALSDSDGIVEGSVPGFANLCRVSVDEMRRALEVLSSPDPDSRTPDNDGRRIEAILGGWQILNYTLYRERGQAKDGSRAPYYRAYRRNKSATVAQHKPVARNTEAEERREKREERRRNTLVGI
jgi:hypothetical protein